MIKKLFGLFIILIIIQVFKIGLFSLEMNAGLVLWYAKWSPHWEDEFRDVFADETTEKSQFKMDNSYIYGPVISFKLSEKFSVSGNFLYGKYEASCLKMWYEGQPRIIQSKMDVEKYDLDLVLSYSLFKYSQLFTGFKYQHYNLNETQQGLYQISGSPFTRELVSNSYGPGLGIGISVPLADTFSVLWNLSGIMLISKIQDEWGDNSGANPPTYTYNMHAYGGNTTIALAYFVPDANITFVTGFRYQYLKYKQKSVSKDNYDPGDEFRFPRNYNNKSDTFMGISISVLYSY